MPAKYYAVKVGKTPGIYLSWEECKSQVDGFKGAVYKSFKTIHEAQLFLENNPDCSKQLSLFENNSGDQKEIQTDKDTIIAYVDGSYNNATNQFSYGMVVFYDGEEYHFSQMIEDEELAQMRNVAGEIMGAQAAMQFALDHHCKSIKIYHDYEGIAKWCLGLWKTNKEGTKAYKEFYDRAKSLIKIEFVKVKGHSQDQYNDLADELAKKALGIL